MLCLRTLRCAHCSISTSTLRLYSFKPVQNAADNVLATHYKTPRFSPLDSLYTLASFKRAFGSAALPGATLSDTDVRVLVRYLARDKQVLVFEQEVSTYLNLYYGAILTSWMA